MGRDQMRFEEIHDDLTKTIWNFYQMGDRIYLDGMFRAKRKTKRHGWKIDETISYSRINNRSYKIKEEPDIPIDISCDALEGFRLKLTIAKWKDR
jgi:hypothetical protein